MTCWEIGYYTLLEDSLWNLCLLPGTEKLCERIMNELKYYYREKAIRTELSEFVGNDLLKMYDRL